MFGAATAKLAAQEPAIPVAAVETVVIEGRVVDLRGEGVPLANVWMAPRLAPDQVVARSVADGEVYFRIGKVQKRDGLQTRATADGYSTSIGMVFDDHTTTVTIQQAATVTGVLRNKGGAPMADTAVGARVNARGGTAVPCRARTDAQGRFVLRGVPIARRVAFRGFPWFVDSLARQRDGLWYVATYGTFKSSSEPEECSQPGVLVRMVLRAKDGEVVRCDIQRGDRPFLEFLGRNAPGVVPVGEGRT